MTNADASWVVAQGEFNRAREAACTAYDAACEEAEREYRLACAGPEKRLIEQSHEAAKAFSDAMRDATKAYHAKLGGPMVDPNPVLGAVRAERRRQP